MAKRKDTNKRKGAKADSNVSKRYPNGRTLQTKDRYLPIDKKGRSENPKESRRVVVIDSNSFDELAIVRLTSRQTANTSFLPTCRQNNSPDKKKSYFKHFVEIQDDQGNPIRVDGVKFVENPWKQDLPKQDVEYIRNGVLNGKRQSAENNQKIEMLKSKKTKKDKEKR